MNVVLYWQEIEERDWPDCCLQCGADGTRLRERKLWVMRYRVIYRVRECIYADLPFCRAHEKAPLWDYYRLGIPHARDFTGEGVLMKNVSPIFIEELERHRDRLDRRDEERVRKKLAVATDGADDRDAEPDRPRRRRDRGAPPPRSSNWLLPTQLILGALLAVPGALGCLCVGGVLLSARNNARQGPAFGPNQPPAFRPGPFRPGGPPFGPNPRFK
jgi:hypothetical protein